MPEGQGGHLYQGAHGTFLEDPKLGPMLKAKAKARSGITLYRELSRSCQQGQPLPAPHPHELRGSGSTSLASPPLSFEPCTHLHWFPAPNHFRPISHLLFTLHRKPQNTDLPTLVLSPWQTWDLSPG